MTEALAQASKSARAARLAPVVRFLVAGAVNTLFSIVIYQAALFVTGHVAAYIMAYIAGIVFAYIIYARHVFNAELSSKRFVAFALFYATSGSAGTVVNAALIDYLTMHPRIAIFATVMIMLPLNYFGSQWSLRGKASPSR
jgi:putative flippase GtrA